MGHPVCYHRVRHIDCHYSGAKEVTEDSDPNRYFNSSAPGIVFFDKDGNFHTIVGNCEITCRP